MTSKPARELTVELNKDGGGLILVEVIKGSSVGALTCLNPFLKTTRRGVDLVVALKCNPVNLPPAKLTSAVHYRAKGGAAWLADRSADLDFPSRTVSAILAPSPTLGEIYERGSDLQIRVVPDHPGLTEPTDSELATLTKDDLPRLWLQLAWDTPAPALPANTPLGSADKPVPPSLGQAVALTLNRGGWACHVRLVVRCTLDDGAKVESVISFGTGGTKATWYPGYDQGVLLLPKPNGAGKLQYTLELQVSADGATFSTLRAVTLVLARPSLQSFHVTVGPEVQRAIAGYVPNMEVDALARMLASLRRVIDPDGSRVRVQGRVTGLASGSVLPFAVELWGYAPDPTPGKPNLMHPIATEYSAVGRIDGAGAFTVPVMMVDTVGEVAALKGHTLFAVLRAKYVPADQPVPLLPAALEHKLRLFGDEDFVSRAPGRGVCSQEVAPDLVAVREPAAGHMSWNMTRYSLQLNCAVTGTPAKWNGAKITIAPEDGSAAATSLNTWYSATSGSVTRGTVSAVIELSRTASFAGKRCKVRLVPPAAAGAVVLDGGGAIDGLDATPRLVEVTWRMEKVGKADAIRFVCRTQFFPLVEWSLDMSFQDLSSGVAVDTAPTKVSGCADDEGKLKILVSNAAQVTSLRALLEAGKLQVQVSRPAGREAIQGVAGLTVARLTCKPTKVG